MHTHMHTNMHGLFIHVQNCPLRVVTVVAYVIGLNEQNKNKRGVSLAHSVENRPVSAPFTHAHTRCLTSRHTEAGSSCSVSTIVSFGWNGSWKLAHTHAHTWRCASLISISVTTRPLKTQKHSKHHARGPQHPPDRPGALILARV